MNDSKVKIHGQDEILGFVQDRINSISHSGHYIESYKQLIDGLTYLYGMGVEGSIAEFGTWTGRSSLVLSQAFNMFEKKYKSSPLRYDRKMYFLDSFQGLPNITAKEDLDSEHVKAGLWKEGSMEFHNPENFESLILNCLNKEQFEVIPGYFSETMESFSKNKKIGLIHCDVDLYSSTIDCLQPLFKNGCITEGAMILFDDWNCSRANPDHGQRKAFSDLCSEFDIVFSNEGSYSYHGHSFIIHSYNTQ